MLLPDYALVKSVDKPELLRDAKLLWSAAGRNPWWLYTLYRHFDIQEAPAGDWESAKDHWRRMFARFIGPTWLEQYAEHIDLVSEANEYMASWDWGNAGKAARALQNMRAAAAVWNDEYRGRFSALAGCRLALHSGVVGHDIPVEVFRLSIAEDCPIDYHAYSRYHAGARSAVDWWEDSGRWDVHERTYGLRPDWVFGECGPYSSADNGWRSADVCGGDLERLAAAYRAWVRDVQATDAYAERRLLGCGAWFTSAGPGSDFPLYEMDAAALAVVATVMAAEWRPGVRETDVTGVIVDPVKLARARAILAELGHLIDGTQAPWWESWPSGVFAARALPTPVADVIMRDATGSPFLPTILRKNAMSAFERRGDLFRVIDVVIGGRLWWVRASELPAPAGV